MGIEPTSKAWEAFVLPLNYTRECVGSGSVSNHPRADQISDEIQSPRVDAIGTESVGFITSQRLTRLSFIVLRDGIYSVHSWRPGMSNHERQRLREIGPSQESSRHFA